MATGSGIESFGLDGFVLTRLDIVPGRVLSLVLSGVRKHSSAEHSLSEIALQFNRLSHIRIEGTLGRNSKLIEEGAVRELSSDDQLTGFHRYEIRLASARINVSASDVSCSVLREDKLLAEDEQALREMLESQKGGTGKVGDGVRHD